MERRIGETTIEEPQYTGRERFIVPFSPWDPIMWFLIIMLVAIVTAIGIYGN